MKHLSVVGLFLIVLVLTACGRSSQQTDFENAGRTALNDMLGFEVQLPNDATVFVEGDRVAEIRFANTLTEDAVNSIMPQFQAAGYELSKTGRDTSMEVLYVPGTSPSFTGTKEGKRFNIAFMPDFGDPRMPLYSIGIVREQ